MYVHGRFSFFSVVPPEFSPKLFAPGTPLVCIWSISQLGHPPGYLRSHAQMEVTLLQSCTGLEANHPHSRLLDLESGKR